MDKNSKMIYSTGELKLKLFSSFDSNSCKGKIYNGDAADFLKNEKSNSACLVFLDPPFNLGKDYGNGKQHDLKPHNEYIIWLSSLIHESYRILIPGGALYIYHLPKIATQITGLLNELLDFRHWIAISMKNNFARGQRLYPAHYALLYYTKGPPYFFNRPKISPVKCRNCGKFIKDYGGYKRIIESQGVNLSDFWDDVSPLRHQNRKSRNTNELPMLILERIISISGMPNGLYIDPFVGGGNGLIAAINGGMSFSVCDNSYESCNLIKNRINDIY